MYFWSLFFRTHSLSRAEPSYSAGDNLSFLTTSSNEVGTTGATCMSGLPQFGLPRFFAIEILWVLTRGLLHISGLDRAHPGTRFSSRRTVNITLTRIIWRRQNTMHCPWPTGIWQHKCTIA